MISTNTAVKRGSAAIRILSMAVEPGRAEALAAQLAQKAGGRPGLFWPSVIRTTVFEAVREIPRARSRIAGLVVLAYATAGALAFVLLVLPQTLLQRPYDDSLLSSWWVREAARIGSSGVGQWIGRNLLAPFLLGAWVAGFARGRELTAFFAVLLSGIVAHFAAIGYAGHLDFTAVLLVYVPRNCIPVLLGIALVRYWRLAAQPRYMPLGR